MKTVLIVNVKIADRLLKAGFELLGQGIVVNGARCFRFKISPGQETRLDRIYHGKS